MTNSTLIKTLLGAVAIIAIIPSAAFAQKAYENYYRYIGEFPEDDRTGWSEDTQGVTHDNSYWYITHGKDVDSSFLWRIPVNLDLSLLLTNSPGVVIRSLNDYPALTNEGYVHWGDLYYHRHNNQDYLLLPMEFGQVGLAVLRANSTMDYVDHAFLDQNKNASWCATDPAGTLYTTNSDDVTKIFRYSIDWNALEGNSPELTLQNLSPINLNLTLQGVQGGVFSPSGDYLYIVANGIHVFDIESGARIKKSVNGSGLFSYTFDPGGLTQEEPEGLTFWDLDGRGAPGVNGQLHVFMLDNDLSADDIFFRHYTGYIYVDKKFNGIQAGLLQAPFTTIGSANNLAWDGAEFKIKAGNYPETPTLSKRVKLTAVGGMVTIGQ